ncbi:MAG TPA: hypothetical protein VIV11_12870 [Kofleriaceae bacterium]
MLRWLGIIIALGLVSAPVDAQVFKPKSKKAAVTEKKAATKKQPRAGATKKRPAKKKSAASARSDEESEPEEKPTGKDYVKIWDDDEIE